MGNGIYGLCNKNSKSDDSLFTMSLNKSRSQDMSTHLVKNQSNRKISKNLDLIEQFKNKKFGIPPKIHNEQLKFVYNNFRKLKFTENCGDFSIDSEEVELSDTIINSKGHIYQGNWKIEFDSKTGKFIIYLKKK